MFTKLNDRLRGYRTRLLAVFVAFCSVALTALQAVGTIDLSGYLGPKAAIFGPFIMAFVMAGLREITTGPAGKAAAAPEQGGPR